MRTCGPRLLFQAARGIAAHHPFFVAAACAGPLAHQLFRPRTGGIGLWGALAIVLLLALLVPRVLARLRLPEREGDGPGPARLLDLEIGALALAALHVLFQATGGAGSPCYPLLYLGVACASLFAEPVASRVLLGLAAAAEGLPLLGGVPLSSFGPQALTHAVFVLLFGLAYAGFLRAQVAFQRSQQRSFLASELRRIADEARAFRLLSATLGPAGTGSPAAVPQQDTLGQQIQEGVHGIRRAVAQQLAMLRDAFGLHSCILYWLDAEGTRLRVLEASSGSDRLSERPVSVGEGIPGTVASTGEAVRLQGLKKSGRGLVHYQSGEQISVLLAVPVRERGRVSGVLLGDRRHDLPFTPGNQAVFEAAAELIVATLQNERVFLALERQKADQEIFHHALKSLNVAQGAAAVEEAVLRAVCGLGPYDLAALTLVEPDGVHQRVAVCAGSSPLAAAVEQRVFGDRGLAGQVVRTRHYLPVGGRVGDRAPVVFGEDLPLEGIRSLLVLPLPYGEEVLGTIVLASERPGAYSQELRERLEVIAHSAAISIKNAQHFELIRKMATTDGLTGLVNHRQFQVRYEEAMARARRTGSPFGLLLIDIDHFKLVNDEHGHPVGDEVLRSVARRLSQTVREVDLVARYGGEEFVVLLEGAAPEGARTMAERIREAVAAEPIAAGGKALRVTISLGLACYPLHGDGRELLLELADQALYAAKRGGRNQVRVHEPRRPEPPRLGPAAIN